MPNHKDRDLRVERHRQQLLDYRISNSPNDVALHAIMQIDGKQAASGIHYYPVQSSGKGDVTHFVDSYSDRGSWHSWRMGGSVASDSVRRFRPTCDQSLSTLRGSPRIGTQRHLCLCVNAFLRDVSAPTPW